MFSSRIINRFNKTVEMAKASKPLCQKFRSYHFATIWDGKRLVSMGFNTNKSHPKANLFGYPWSKEATHAETCAVLRAKLEDFRGLDIFVVRIGNHGGVILSKPCKCCSILLKQLNFDNIFYSTNEAEIERLNCGN